MTVSPCVGAYGLNITSHMYENMQLLPHERAILESAEFEQYLEARTELMRLRPFIHLEDKCRTYEQLYQRFIAKKLSQI